MGEGVTPTSACQGLDRDQGSRAAAVLRHAMSSYLLSRSADPMGLSRAVLLAVACVLGLTNEPALSRAPDERVEVIMSKLPPKGGPAYRAFRILAGKPPVQVLTLTNMEVWSLAHNRVAAVKRAAARFGVGVDELAADWNYVLRPVPAPTICSSDRKAERAQANNPGPPTEISMVLPPRAAMVEYALTKGVREETSPGRPAKIVVKLNETTVLTLTRTNVEITPAMCTWHGTVDGTDRRRPSCGGRAWPWRE